jgi:signal transduction histidine kinase
MMQNKAEERTIIMAPVGQDATAMAAVLESQGFHAEVSSGPEECCRRIAEGAGALLFTEESLELPGISVLFETLKAQPPWSELPLIVLTKGGETRLARLLDLIAEVARSVTLLERPMSGSTLLRSVQVALRSRHRQYQVRDLIEQQERAQEQLREGAESLCRMKEELAQSNAELEKRVQKRTAELRAVNEQLETFVYSVAHDLRAPLRSITGYSQLLLDDYSGGLEKTAQHLIKRVQASSEFMDKLLLDLLAFGRTARAEMELGTVPVRAAWDGAVFQCAMQIEQSHARVETASPLPSVCAHEATLTQCLANLLGNALKFVTPGAQPHVRFSAEENGRWVRLFVEDEGIGIPEQQQERAFRVFERLNGTRYPGTGIGLSIVRKGVERMGGKVGVESGPGKGSRFWIELPKAG